MNYRMTSFYIRKNVRCRGACDGDSGRLFPRYTEKRRCVRFLITSAVLMVLFFDFRAQKAGECDDLCKGRICDCGAGMDSMVRIRSTSRFIFRERCRNISMHCLRLCPVLQQQVLLF